MEKRTCTNTINSSHPSTQEAAASIDPLVQPINDQDDEPVYLHRQSSIFYIPANSISEDNEENIAKNKPNIITRFLIYMERFSGILYALLTSVLFTCSNYLLKQFDIIIFDVLIIRFFILALISFGFIMYKGYPLIPNCNRVLLFFRTISAASTTILFFLGLTILPLSDLTTIQYTQVVWTAVLALIIFRERITIPTILASILTLTGVVCVAQPTFLFPQSKVFNETLQETMTINNNKRLIGMLVAVSCALSISMSSVLNKKLLQKHVRHSIIMFYYILITCIILLIIQIHYWVFSKSNNQEFNFKKIFLTKDFIFATIISITQIVPMIFVQKAIKREHPSIVSIVQSSDILFAIILQNVFSSSKSNLLAIIGSILVLTSIFIVGGQKLWLDRKNRTCVPTSIQENELKVEIKNNE